ncbi:MAG: redoxin domain-containing protein [Phycisphaerae bacterium]|nr:redoxin domain-containing protein [Phycisphaerae bacterium]
MKKRSGILIVMLFAVVFAGCKKKDPAAPPEESQTAVKQIKPMVEKRGDAVAKRAGQAVDGMPTKIGDAAWNLKGLEFIKGKPVKIEPGKVYIVEFWATWCGPCLTSIPHLTEVAHKYKDKNVMVVGISKEQADVVKPFVEKQGAKMDYNVAVDPTRNVNEGYMKAFGKSGIPHAFIVDAEGKIAWHGHPMADMEQVLDGVLAGTFDAAMHARKKAEEQAKYKASRETYQAYFAKIRSGGTMEEARAIMENWTDEASDSLLNSLAWEILTEVEEDKRDIKLALDAAERANKLTKGKNGAVLDTYALALFQNGKVEEAIGMQAKALEAAKGNERMEADLQKRLDEYRAAKKE